MKKNDAKLTKLKEYTESDKFRDQGFTRPKVKVLNCFVMMNIFILFLL